MSEHEPMRMDIAVVQNVFPEMTAEQTREWKIEKKSNYSQAYRKKSPEELLCEFPEGKVRAGRFTVDTTNRTGEPIRKIFDERGFEVERAKYDKGALPGDDATDKSFSERVTSHYDEEGYLVGVILIRKESLGNPGGFVRIIEYETLDTQHGTSKVPKRLITQAVLSVPHDTSLRTPGWSIGYKPPIIIDFTDVPFIPPQEIEKSDTPESSFTDM